MENAPPHSSNVARFLPERAASQPEAIALKIPRRSKGRLTYEDVTFRELDRAVDRRCRYLTAGGIHRGQRVLLMVRAGKDLIVLVFALFKIGAVPVLIDPGMGLRGFLRCLERTQPEAMVAIPLGRAAAFLFRMAFRSVTVRLGPGADDADEPDTGGESFPTAACAAVDAAAVLFTSGSTGPAKGVCYEHGMFEAQVRAIRDHYGIEPGEIDLPMLPVFALFNPALGMTTVVPEMNPSRPAEVDPARIVEAVQTCGVTNSFGSPVLWKKIGAHCEANGIRLPSLRRILMAGAPVPPALVATYRDILEGGEIHSPYGATEALPVSSISGREILEETRSATEGGAGTCVGRPFPEIRVRVVPILEGRMTRISAGCPAGEIGEILVAGPVVTRAYDRLPEATAAAKVEEGETLWHRMGDAGYLDDDGRLWFCGRVAERVVTSETTLYTDCCEAVFNQVDGVFRSALIGLGARGRQTPALVIQPESEAFPGNDQEKRDFIRRLSERGSRYDITRDIRTFFFHRRFPVDVRHNAKIHRLTLARKYSKHVS